MRWRVERLAADLAVVGGGVAGLAAAIELRRRDPGLRVLVVEKAQVERSGCLAAGVNAINAYLHRGETPASFLAFVQEEWGDLVREDLVLSMAEGFNRAVDWLAAVGVPFPRGVDGGYLRRGRHAVPVHGERLKPILAARARQAGVALLNRVAAADYILAGERVVGVYALGVQEPVLYVISSRAVLCATGGAGGLYPPANQGLPGRTWYPPFNAGAGYAMGLRAGARLTSLEGRFIPLRVKDTCAPTGTVAQGVHAPQVNGRGESYLLPEERTAAARLAATLRQEAEGNGPCYLDTTGLSAGEARRLREAYLEMCPVQVLWWADRQAGPRELPLEVAGSEPCLVGGHGPAGYWVDAGRRATLPGLYAAGDVAGGAPKKYVSGSMVEGWLAAGSVLADLPLLPDPAPPAEREVRQALRELAAPLGRRDGVSPAELEESLRKTTAEYAGGAASGYRLDGRRLALARARLRELRREAVGSLRARDPHELVRCREAVDRLLVASAMVEHLLYREETRWPPYQRRSDYPRRDDGRWRVFVNSRYRRESDEFLLEEYPEGRQAR